MAYDKNQYTFSGKVQDVKQIQTKTGTPMVSFFLQCWKEQIKIVCFKELAEQVLNALHDGDRAEIAGRLQTSSWEKNGTKHFGFQIIADEIRADTGSQDQGTERQKSKCSIGANKPAPPQQQNRNEYDYSGGPF